MIFKFILVIYYQKYSFVEQQIKIVLIMGVTIRIDGIGRIHFVCRKIFKNIL